MLSRRLFFLAVAAAVVGVPLGVAMRGELDCSWTRWLVGGVLVSGLLGDVVTRAVWHEVHSRLDRELVELKWNENKRSWLPRWTGWTERALFTVLVAIKAPNVPAAAIGWMALKMAAGWQRGAPIHVAETYSVRARSSAALLCSVTSLAMAALGGFLCNAQIDGICQEHGP